MRFSMSCRYRSTNIEWYFPCFASMVKIENLNVEGSWCKFLVVRLAPCGLSYDREKVVIREN